MSLLVNTVSHRVSCESVLGRLFLDFVHHPVFLKKRVLETGCFHPWVKLWGHVLVGSLKKASSFYRTQQSRCPHHFSWGWKQTQFPKDVFFRNTGWLTKSKNMILPSSIQYHQNPLELVWLCAWHASSRTQVVQQNRHIRTNGNSVTRLNVSRPHAGSVQAGPTGCHSASWCQGLSIINTQYYCETLWAHTAITKKQPGMLIRDVIMSIHIWITLYKTYSISGIGSCCITPDMAQTCHHEIPRVWPYQESSRAADLGWLMTSRPQRCSTLRVLRRDALAGVSKGCLPQCPWRLF
jgi:hypothetical protein